MGRRAGPAGLVVLAGLWGCAFNSGGAGGEDKGGLDGDLAADSSGGATQAGAEASSSGGGDPGDAGDTSGGPEADTGAGEGWWDANWGFRRAFDLDVGDLEAPLVDVPVLVVLQPDELDPFAAGGADLRVVDADGELLSYEVESWEPSLAVVWVGVPRLVGPTHRLWLYWGQAAAQAEEHPAGVWRNGFAGVWHLAEDPGSNPPLLLDSGPSGYHATPLGSMPSEARLPGKIGAALDFDGLDDHLSVGAIGSDTWTGFTLEAWFRLDGGIGGGLGVGGHILCKASDVFGVHVMCLGVRNSFLVVSAATDGEAGVSAEYELNPVPQGPWTHAAASWSAASGALEVYINGVLVATRPHAGDTVLDSPSPVWVGDERTLGYFPFAGALDELRLSQVPRSAAWFDIQHRSMSGELGTLGPVESN